MNNYKDKLTGEIIGHLESTSRHIKNICEGNVPENELDIRALRAQLTKNYDAIVRGKVLLMGIEG